jgi:hypothetical protein
MRRKYLTDRGSMRVVNPPANSSLLWAKRSRSAPTFPHYFPDPLHASRMPGFEQFHHLPSGIFRVALPNCGYPNPFGSPVIKLPFWRYALLEVLIGGTPTLFEQSQHRRCAQRKCRSESFYNLIRRKFRVLLPNLVYASLCHFARQAGQWWIQPEAMCHSQQLVRPRLQRQLDDARRNRHRTMKGLASAAVTSSLRRFVASPR